MAMPEQNNGITTEESCMTSDSTRRSDFKNKMSRHVVFFLQFSLWLTKNGRDAVELMREAMAEAYRSWDESMPEESRRIWLHNIFTRRFIVNIQPPARPQVANCSDTAGEHLVRNNQLSPGTTTNARQQSWQIGASDDDVNYFEAFAGLPAVCRSAMILSYLEGFSNAEIADLAHVRPPAVESILHRGRTFIREELFAHLMGDDCIDAVADREAESA